MNWTQGPGRGPLAPDAGREVGPGAGRGSRRPGGDTPPRPASPRSTPPSGAEPPGWIVRGVREQRCQPRSRPALGAQGQRGPRAAAPSSVLLSPAPAGRPTRLLGR